MAFRPNFSDALGNSVQKRICEDLSISVSAVRTVDVYAIDSKLSKDELELLGRELFADPITQIYSFQEPLARRLDWDFAIEVGYKPGVTDSPGQTARSAIQELLKKNTNVYTSRQYLIRGELSFKEAERIAKELLANELIERFSIIERKRWDGKMRIEIPAVRLRHEPTVAVIDLDVSDEELLKISKERLLALNLEEMKAVQRYFRDKAHERRKFNLPPAPTDVELEALAQNWSEHCKHKIFKAFIEYHEDGDDPAAVPLDSVFQTFIKGATEKIQKDWLVSVFVDNSGVIKLDDEYHLAFKVETHNAPSALDPYGGALTGIVGVNRDPLGTGLGARLIFNTDVFCFADPNYDQKLPKGVLHPKRIFEGVRRGVEHGGNKSGVPTVNGTIRFDNRYLGRPLVYCGTAGIMPAKVNQKSTHEKKVESGDLIVMVGGRIGKDGIHGATFSSERLHEESPVSAVQIGDPFTQKKLADMLLEARDLDLYKAVHDNGAGGLSCSVGELSEKSNGCELYLEKAPLKYQGLDPWEILLSESQERMTLAVSPAKIDTFLELAQARDVEATVIGQFTNTGKFHALYEGKTVAYLDVPFLLEGYPKKHLKAVWKQPRYEEPNLAPPKDLNEILHKLLRRLNICSKEYVIRQYDHEVQGGSIIKPLVGAQNDGPSDAAVIWPIELMRKRSKRGVVVSNGINPNYGDIDTYHMAACAVDEAIRNAVAVGADLEHLALLDNFSWSSSDDEFRLAQLVRACKALYDYATAFGTPFISGKDSMFNDFLGELAGKPIKLSVPPTLLISAIGVIEDIEKAVTMDIKSPGDLIYMLGVTKEELGGSEYFAMMGEELKGERFTGNRVPQVDAVAAKRIYEALHRAIMEELVEACHDCSEGGLGVAAAEMAFAGGVGVALDLKKVPGGATSATPFGRDDFVLFSESASRLLVEVRPQNRKRFEALFKGCPCALIGETISEKQLIVYGLKGQKIIAEDLGRLKESWERTLRR